MSEPTNSQADAETPVDLAEGYPGLADVLSAISRADDLPDRGVRRVEINLFASGEATYRYWTVDLIEPEGGYLDRV